MPRTAERTTIRGATSYGGPSLQGVRDGDPALGTCAGRTCETPVGPAAPNSVTAILTFPLGRIAGVPVGLNWSGLVTFAMLAWVLTAHWFPAYDPDQPMWVHTAAGIGTALVFFAGLLAHELAHAIVARRQGLQVQHIMLWLLGGITRLGGEAPTARAELRIAGSGPLVNLIIAMVFTGLATAVGTLADAALVLGMLIWLALINVVFAAVNVIPASPLDGGRLLRAGLWWWRGDRTWAAVVAARAGRVLGAALVVVGAWEAAFIGPLVDGLWVAMLGSFLVTVAGAEERKARADGGRVLEEDPVQPARTSVGERQEQRDDRAVEDVRGQAHHRRPETVVACHESR